MGWLRRSADLPAPEPDREDGEVDLPLRRAAPGIAALFEGLIPDGRYRVLDLGPGSGAHLRLYGRFAHEVGFAGLLPRPPRGRRWSAVLDGLPGHPERPWTLVLLWNILDLLSLEERDRLIDTLVAITAPRARIYAVADASRETMTHPYHFALDDLGHLTQEVAGPGELAAPKILPAEAERLLAPFEIHRGFTLRPAMREYLAVKGAGAKTPAGSGAPGGGEIPHD